MTDLLDALIANPGLYCGSQDQPDDPSNTGSTARIVVALLPGGAGVSFDYEVVSRTDGRVHLERATLARTMSGLVLATAHSHGTVLTIMPETEPGTFPSTGATSPFPIQIRLEVPEAGKLIYEWSYGGGDEPLKVREIATVALVTD